MAILKLVENKQLHLNDSITNLLSEKTQKALVDFGYNTNKITIKNLL